MALTQVSSGGIKDGSITNADLDSSAAIDGSKVSPDFGSQNIVTTGTITGASLIPSSNTVPANGIYLSGTNTVAVATNGVGRLFVDSDGKILLNQSGVLSQATTQKFEVKGDIVINSATTGAGAEGVLHFFQLVSDSSASRSGAKIASVNSGTYTAGDVYSYDSDLAFSTTLNSSLTEKFRITRGGYVGIGTSAPDTLLTVNGSAKIGTSTTTFINSKNISQSLAIAGTYTPGIMMKSSNLYTGEWSVYLKAAASVTSFAIADDADDRLVIDSSGRVGIGTATPLGILDARGFVYSLATNNAANRGYYSGPSDFVTSTKYLFTGWDHGLQGGIYYTQGAFPHIFYTSNQERARIDSSGRLLVGTSTSSGYQLEVSGSFRSNSTVRNGIFFADSNTGANIGAQAKLYRLAKGYVGDTINNINCFQFNISTGFNSLDYAAFAGKLTIVQAGSSAGGTGFRTAYFINILVFRHASGTISLTLGAPEVLGTAISPTITLTSASNTQAVLGIDLNASQNTRDGYFTATLEGSTVGRSTNDQFTISVV